MPRTTLGACGPLLEKLWLSQSICASRPASIAYRSLAERGRAVFEETGGMDRPVNAAETGFLIQSSAALTPGKEIAVSALITVGEPVDGIPLMNKALTTRG